MKLIIGSRRVRSLQPLDWSRIWPALSIVILTSIPVQAETVASLSGQWELNKEDSDDLREKMMEARQSDRSDRSGRSGRSGGARGGGGGRGGMGGGPSGGFGGARGGTGGGRGGNRPPGASSETPSSPIGIMRGADLLVIEQDAEQVKIRYSDDSERLFITDGKKQESELPNGDSLTTTAVWKEGQLMVTAKSKEGGKTTEWYQLTDSGDRLIVKLDLPGRSPRPAIQLKRIYDLTGSIESNESIG